MQTKAVTEPRTASDYIRMPDDALKLRDTLAGLIDGTVVEDHLHLTGTGNAELIAELFGNHLRYDHRRHRWLLFKKNWWAPDTNGHISRMAVDAARIRYSRATTVKDLKERQQVASWAILSENDYA